MILLKLYYLSKYCLLKPRARDFHYNLPSDSAWRLLCTSVNLPASLQTLDFFSVHREQQHSFQGWGGLDELYKNAESILCPLAPLLWPQWRGPQPVPSAMRGHKVTLGGILPSTELARALPASLAAVTAVGHVTACLGVGPKGACSTVLQTQIICLC